MLKPLFAALLALSLVFGGLTYAKTAKRTSATKSRTVKSASKAKKSTKSAKSSSKRTTKSAASKKKSRSKRTVARRSTQQAPTPDRYSEIQQALADKGYYEGPVNGVWGAASVDALKRFQQDQRLKQNGKLDSLTIIALGLGPKRNLSARSTTEPKGTEEHDNRRPEGSERP